MYKRISEFVKSPCGENQPCKLGDSLKKGYA